MIIYKNLKQNDTSKARNPVSCKEKTSIWLRGKTEEGEEKWQN